MNPKDNPLKDSKYQKLLHNDAYYQHIFKKTEKIVSVVFYILNNIEVDKKSETHTSNLASKAHFAHENALRTLEVKPANATEVLEQFAQSLIGLESTLRIVASAGVIDQQVLMVVVGEITGVLRSLRNYLDTDNSLPDDLFKGIAESAGTETAPLARRSATNPRTHALRAAAGPEAVAAPTAAGAAASAQNERRVRISTILGAKGEATIKDISEIITDVSEKTIQRELNAMIGENVVKREGERRWSKYSLV